MAGLSALYSLTRLHWRAVRLWRYPSFAGKNRAALRAASPTSQGAGGRAIACPPPLPPGTPGPLPTKAAVGVDMHMQDVPAAFVEVTARAKLKPS